MLTLDLTVEIITSVDATIAIVSGFNPDGTWVEWSGVAKRDPVDKYDLEVGTKLALSRALGAASRQIGRQAAGRVKSIDDNRAQSQAAKEKKTKEPADDEEHTKLAVYKASKKPVKKAVKKVKATS